VAGGVASHPNRAWVALAALRLGGEVAHGLYLAFLFGMLAYTWVFALR